LCHPSYKLAVSKGGEMSNAKDEQMPQIKPKDEQMPQITSKDVAPEILISESDLEWVSKVSKLYLRAWFANGPIAYDDYCKLKFDLMHETQDMLRKKLLTPADFQIFKMDALSFDMKMLFRKHSISEEADYEALKIDMRRFGLECEEEKGVISAADCEVLKNDLNMLELEYVLKKGFISSADYHVLKADLAKIEVKDAFEKKLISSADFEQLQGDLEKLTGA
jgi:hypothetical protein